MSERIIERLATYAPVLDVKLSERKLVHVYVANLSVRSMEHAWLARCTLVMPKKVFED